jgi:AraC-like DNA-binding protein
MNADTMAQEEMFDIWHEITSLLFDTLPLKNPKTYSFSTTAYQINDLVFTHVSFDIQQFRRAARQLSQDGSDFLLLQFYQQGQQGGYLDNGLSLVNGPEIISLQDLAHSYTAIGKSADTYGLLIPRHLISVHDQIYCHQPYLGWSADSPQGRILLSNLFAIWQELPHATQAEAASLASGLVGLLNGLLTAKLDAETRLQVDRATLKAMEDYAIANLQDPNFRVKQLCEKFHCSRAQVYRLFKTYGGVQNFLREQRLFQFYQALQKSPNSSISQIKISDIAQKFGFYNPSYLSRLFKERYGISPSELLNRSKHLNLIQDRVTQNDYDHEVRKFRRWIESSTSNN